jgi:hypothetical protein
MAPAASKSTNFATKSFMKCESVALAYSARESPSRQVFTSSSIIEPNRLRRALYIDVIKISTFSKSNAGEGVADFVAAPHKKRNGI